MFSVYLIDCTQAFHEMKPIINQNQISRRTFVQKSSFLAAGTAMSPKMVFGYKESALRRSAMGVATSSYANRWRAGDTSKKLPGFENALQLLMHCESIGASGVQVGSRNWSDDFTGKVRDFRETKDLYLEGSIRLPENEADIDRFASEAINSKEAGATILRTACLSGRRYENFETGQAFEEFRKTSIKSIERAAPILEKYRLKRAIENHKDWRVPDLLALLLEPIARLAPRKMSFPASLTMLGQRSRKGLTRRPAAMSPPGA